MLAAPACREFAVALGHSRAGERWAAQPQLSQIPESCLALWPQESEQLAAPAHRELAVALVHSRAGEWWAAQSQLSQIPESCPALWPQESEQLAAPAHRELAVALAQSQAGCCLERRPGCWLVAHPGLPHERQACSRSKCAAQKRWIARPRLLPMPEFCPALLWAREFERSRPLQNCRGAADQQSLR